MTKELDFHAVDAPTSFASALNHYSSNFDSSHSKKWSLDWLNTHAPEHADRLKNEPERAFSNRGHVCRILHRGFKDESGELHSKLKQFFETMPVYVPPPVEPAAPKPRKAPAANEVIMRLEDMVDDIISDREPQTITLPVDEKQLKAARGWIEKEVVEVVEQIEKFKAILAGLEDAYQRSGGVINNLAKPKPKAVATPEPSKQMMSQAAKTVTYLKEDKALGLTSVSPARIVGAKRAFVYQTKYKIGMVFVAKEGGSLTIAGSSIRGFDSEKSFMRSIKKPAEFFNSSDPFQALELETSKRTPVTSHISPTMLIVSAEK
jgi:hypothetical protein